MWQRIVRIVPREVAWNGDFLGDWRCLWKVHGMHQTYFLIDGSQFLVKMVPNFVLCKCKHFLFDNLCIWYGPNSYYLGGCLYIEEQRLEWLRYSMFKVFLLNTIRRQGVFVFWHRESQLLPLSLLRANQQIQNYPQFIQGRRPDHVWFLQNHHACYILHFLRILPYR